MHAHAQTLFGQEEPNEEEPAFSTIADNGDAKSIPTAWRRKQKTTKPRTHPEVADFVEKGMLIVALIRYPPSSLLSSLNRFQNRSEEVGQRITGVLSSGGCCRACLSLCVRACVRVCICMWCLPVLVWLCRFWVVLVFLFLLW